MFGDFKASEEQEMNTLDGSVLEKWTGQSEKNDRMVVDSYFTISLNMWVEENYQF